MLIDTAVTMPWLGLVAGIDRAENDGVRDETQHQIVIGDIICVPHNFGTNRISNGAIIRGALSTCNLSKAVRGITTTRDKVWAGGTWMSPAKFDAAIFCDLRAALFRLEQKDMPAREDWCAYSPEELDFGQYDPKPHIALDIGHQFTQPVIATRDLRTDEMPRDADDENELCARIQTSDRHCHLVRVEAVAESLKGVVSVGDYVLLKYEMEPVSRIKSRCGTTLDVRLISDVAGIVRFYRDADVSIGAGKQDGAGQIHTGRF